MSETEKQFSDIEKEYSARRERRWKIAEVSAAFLVDALTRSLKGKIPADTVVVRVQYNNLKDVFDVCLQSIEFDQLPEGGMPPIVFME